MARYEYLKMSPALPTFYPADLVGANLIVVGYSLLFSWIRSYCKHISIRKFSRRGVSAAPIIPADDLYPLPLGRAIAPTFCHPALRNSVLRIIFFCAKEQVRRIYAGRIIATVQNERPARNGAECQQPRYSMGHHLSAANGDAPVCYFPVKIDAVAKPIPTPRGGGFVDFGPESIGSSWRIHGSIMTYGVHCE